MKKKCPVVLHDPLWCLEVKPETTSYTTMLTWVPIQYSCDLNFMLTHKAPLPSWTQMTEKLWTNSTYHRFQYRITCYQGSPSCDLWRHIVEVVLVIASILGVGPMQLLLYDYDVVCMWCSSMGGGPSKDLTTVLDLILPTLIADSVQHNIMEAICDHWSGDKARLACVFCCQSFHLPEQLLMLCMSCCVLQLLSSSVY